VAYAGGATESHERRASLGATIGLMRVLVVVLVVIGGAAFAAGLVYLIGHHMIAQDAHTITYEVTATGTGEGDGPPGVMADIRYSGGGGSGEVNDVAVPWSKTITSMGSSSYSLRVVDLTDTSQKTSDVVCMLKIDGEVVSSNTESDHRAAATCSGST
jgi:Mycobacterium membrane protein